MQNTILSRILQHAPANRPVARNTLGMELSMTGFLAGAAVWRSTAQHLRLPNAVLYAEDAAELLPALFGCWAAGVHVVLPGDALPGTPQRSRADREKHHAWARCRGNGRKPQLVDHDP